VLIFGVLLTPFPMLGMKSTQNPNLESLFKQNALKLKLLHYQNRYIDCSKIAQ